MYGRCLMADWMNLFRNVWNEFMRCLEGDLRVFCRSMEGGWKVSEILYVREITFDPIFSRPNYFDHILFLTQNSFVRNIFLDPVFFGPKFFLAERCQGDICPPPPRCLGCMLLLFREDVKNI